MWEALVQGPPRRLTRDPRPCFFDFGGVILSSPFEAFNGFEARNGLPRDFIRTINATNPDTNAWARFERSEVTFDEFCDLFEAECREQGHEVAARELMPLLAGEIRPAMVEAVRRCRERLVTACLTNNWVSFDDFPADARAGGRDDALGLFDHVIESARSACASPTRASTSWPARRCGVEPERGRVPRRPRREPQAGRRHGHDHDQGRRPRPTPSPSSRRWSASRSADRALEVEGGGEELGLLLGVDGVRAGGRAAGLVAATRGGSAWVSSNRS